MRNYSWLFLSIIILSCGNNRHEAYHSFNHNGWHCDSIVSFRYPITDTINKYDFSLKIRHTVDYEFQNLFIFLEEETKDTIEIMLSKKSGKWLGRGISDVREFEYVFHKGRNFTEKGEFELKIEQAMRYGSLEKITNLRDILDIGLIVVEHSE